MHFFLAWQRNVRIMLNLAPLLDVPLISDGPSPREWGCIRNENHDHVPRKLPYEGICRAGELKCILAGFILSSWLLTHHNHPRSSRPQMLMNLKAKFKLHSIVWICKYEFSTSISYTETCFSWDDVAGLTTKPWVNFSTDFSNIIS